MPGITRRSLLQLSIAGAASCGQQQPNGRSPLESLWLQRAEIIRRREQSMASACDDDFGDALWALFGQRLDDIERQVRQLPADHDTIAAQLLIDYENYSLRTAIEIGSPRESLKWIADAYLRVHKSNLSGFIFR